MQRLKQPRPTHFAVPNVLFWVGSGAALCSGRRSRYYRHGLEDEDFLSAFEDVRSVEREYDGLAKAFGGSEERKGW